MSKNIDAIIENPLVKLRSVLEQLDGPLEAAIAAMRAARADGTVPARQRDGARLTEQRLLPLRREMRKVHTEIVRGWGLGDEDDEDES